MYNCTPHSSTGYTPHYLVFGTEARLPVDFLLNVSNSDEEEEDEWIKVLKERLDTAWNSAGAQLQKEMLTRKSLYDKQTKPYHLREGDKVLLRNHQIRGRNKIQDYWMSEVYVVINVLNSVSGVYRIKQLSGKDERVVH